MSSYARLRAAALTAAVVGALAVPATAAFAAPPSPSLSPAAVSAAEGFSTARDHSTLLVAGGSVAAVGAAGIGFATLRRGRSES
ncbi:hypothetical protein [Streptomyces purpureus]|uniref:hypothetical protein n=1 Tax=Streptomyces purpureus TaxID=1951 RepID=UPI0003797B63|nr:hypothetical protein [Streptomyces purpureus]